MCQIQFLLELYTRLWWERLNNPPDWISEKGKELHMEMEER